MSALALDLPESLAFLFEPSRYKVAYGGRGSAKSWSIARALLVKAVQSPLRILCGREVQRSIKDSVHRLLSDQIDAIGLGAHFQILETEIRGANGSLILFAGLSTQSIESIKSYEGVDICWIEEGQVVSKRSWDILIPTIRKPNSEIWISMNPELETDETAQRFIENPPPDALVRKINYIDNPWFPDVLEQERLHCQKRDPRNYPNIWLGDYKPAVEGAIYYDEMAAVAADKRLRNVPHDPMLLVHTVWDFGFNDATAIVFVQVAGAEIRIIDYIEDNARPLSDYVRELRERRYNYGNDYLPHDGFATRIETGKSIAQMMGALGREVARVPQLGIEPGIRLVREMFPRVYFDQTKSRRLAECLKRYRRNIPVSTGEATTPVHDEFSHGADAFRYLAACVEQMGNEMGGNDHDDWRADQGRSEIGGY